jgi:ADP-ribose pyrophosphatase YjhB (NUDIX family)
VPDAGCQLQRRPASGGPPRDDDHEGTVQQIVDVHEAMPFTRQEFDAIYSRVPRLNVEVVIRTPAGVVLSKRNIEPCVGYWHIPGGTLRFDESLEDGARRVARTEVGVDVRVGRLLGLLEYPRLRAEGYAGWPVGVAFEASIVSGRLQPLDQADEVGCFTDLPQQIFADQVELLTSLGIRDRLPLQARSA